MDLLLVGMNHHIAPVEVREQVAFNDNEAAQLLQTIIKERYISECIVLSTCNRTEIYAGTMYPQQAEHYLRGLVCDTKAVDHFRNPEITYRHDGWEVVHHLFRVSCSLDSQIVGETQISKQIKNAYAISITCKTTGILFNRLFHRCFTIGKRARTETAIGRGAVSISRAAVELAQKVFSDISSHTVLLIGAGETAKLTAGHLSEKGVNKLLICNRTYSRAVELAREMKAEAVDFGNLDEALVMADIVIGSTASPEPVIGLEHMRRIMHLRGKRQIFMVDIAVPRDFDPAINKLSNVILNDIDNLELIVEKNIEERRLDIPRVEKIIHEGVLSFKSCKDSLSLAPTIKILTKYFEDTLTEELQRSKKKLKHENWQQLELFVKGAVKRLLHNPIMKLKEYQEDSSLGMLRIDTIRNLFDLDAADDNHPEKNR